MNGHQIAYLVFGTVLVVALIADLGLLNRKNKSITIKTALLQTIFWVALAFCFFGYLLFTNGNLAPNLTQNPNENIHLPLEFISAYLMEWSLSIDNIFVFILIFQAFKVKPKFRGRVLLIGVLMAIVFRIIFITVGVVLVNKFHFILYIFGFFLIYTGYKMFVAKEDDEYNPQESKFYIWLNKILPLTTTDGNGKFTIKEHGKTVFTSLFVVVFMLAVTDILFAFDSIPAVMGISKDSMIIYTSNIFAVLGLRSLFFLLQGAVNKFQHLQKGISIVLVFIGVKMLIESFLLEYISKSTLTIISLFVIILCIMLSIAYSIYHNKKMK